MHLVTHVLNATIPLWGAVLLAFVVVAVLLVAGAIAGGIHENWR